MNACYVLRKCFPCTVIIPVLSFHTFGTREVRPFAKAHTARRGEPPAPDSQPGALLTSEGRWPHSAGGRELLEEAHKTSP